MFVRPVIIQEKNTVQRKKQDVSINHLNTFQETIVSHHPHYVLEQKLLATFAFELKGVSASPIFTS